MAVEDTARKQNAMFSSIGQSYNFTITRCNCSTVHSVVVGCKYITGEAAAQCGHIKDCKIRIMEEMEQDENKHCVRKWYAAKGINVSEVRFKDHDEGKGRRRRNARRAIMKDSQLRICATVRFVTALNGGYQGARAHLKNTKTCPFPDDCITSRACITCRPPVAEGSDETTCLCSNVPTGHRVSPDPTRHKARHSKWNYSEHLNQPQPTRNVRQTDAATKPLLQNNQEGTNRNTTDTME